MTDDLISVVFKLWTVYLEQLGGGTDASVLETCVLEFWGKVTPGILQLLSLSKAVSYCFLLFYDFKATKFSIQCSFLINLNMK